MKNLNFLGILAILAMLFASQPASAVVSVQNNQETATAAVSKKELKNQARLEKMVNKIQKKMEKRGGLVDRNDDTGKWLWWAIVLAIISIVLSIISWFVPFGWYLSGLLWSAATICLLIWLLKYLEVI